MNLVNDLAKKYCSKAEDLLSKSEHRKNFKCKWTDSLFQERLMRFGIEVKLFELEITDTASIEKCVRSSLIYSFLEKCHFKSEKS